MRGTILKVTTSIVTSFIAKLRQFVIRRHLLVKLDVCLHEVAARLVKGYVIIRGGARGHLVKD